MIWYVPTLSFDNHFLHAATPSTFLISPNTRQRNYAHIIPSRLRVCERALFQQVHRQVHGCRVCTYIHLGSPHTKVPARPMPCSHARSSERMRRDKGSKKAFCEVPVVQTTAGIADAAAAATSLNALVGCRLVGFFFLSHRTHTRAHLCVLFRLADRWRGCTTCVNHKLTCSYSGFCKISPPQERTSGWSSRA
jgi:hypothetical protein